MTWVQNTPVTFRRIGSHRYWPVIFETGGEEPTQLLIREPFYDIAQTLYDWYKGGSYVTGFDAITGVLELLPAEELGCMAMLLRVLVMAVKSAVTKRLDLGKFRPHRGWGVDGIVSPSTFPTVE